MAISSKKIYGYCRISLPSQSIDRQIRNIKEIYKEAIIYQEAKSGTKMEGREELDKLIGIVEPGDSIVFDSASRMSRNSEEAMELYESLFSKGVELIFLKEPHINTELYRKNIENGINVEINTGQKSTDELLNAIISALNKFSIDLAKDQVRIVFDQAQKEVEDLHQRVSEGLKTAKLKGKILGRRKSSKVVTRKAKKAKKAIFAYSCDFNGNLSDKEIAKVTGLSYSTIHHYHKELAEKYETKKKK